MLKKSKLRREGRDRRKKRVRKNIVGTTARPRLCVYRSLQYSYAQLVDDEAGKVIATISSKSISSAGSGKSSSKSNKDTAKEVGKKIAELAKEKGISRVVFDRNGYLYHGRVAALADGAREGGLNF